MMEDDTGEQWTSTVSALFIRVCKHQRITVMMVVSGLQLRP